MNDFSSLFSSDFFVREISKWISLQSFGRLKSLNKQTFGKFTFDPFVINNPIAFRRAIFRGKIQIVELFIGHYFINYNNNNNNNNNDNNNQSSLQKNPFFPKTICVKLLELTSNDRYLEITKKIFSMSTQLFPTVELEDYENSCLEATKQNQQKLVKFYSELFTRKDLDFNSRQIFQESLQLAYDKVGNRELIILLLEQFSKIEKEISFLLVHINQSISIPTIRPYSEPFYDEWLFSLCSQSYRNNCSLKEIFSVDISSFFSEQFPTHLDFDDFLSNLDSVPLVLPKSFIDSFQELKFEDEETMDSHLFHISLFRKRWSLFIGDFSSFRNSVQHWKDIFFPKFTDFGKDLLDFVINRCIDRPSATSCDFLAFNHCIDILKKDKSLLSTPTFGNRMVSLFRDVAHADRFDLAIRIHEISTIVEVEDPRRGGGSEEEEMQSERPKLSLSDSFICDVLASLRAGSPDSKVDSFLLKHFKQQFETYDPEYYDSSQNLSNICKSADLDLVRSKIESGDPSSLEELDQSFHQLLHQSCLFCDFEMVQYLLSLRSKFPNSITRKIVASMYEVLKKDDVPFQQESIILDYLSDCVKGKIKGWEL